MIKQLFHNNKKIIVSLITTSLFEKIKSLIIFFQKTNMLIIKPKNTIKRYKILLTKKSGERFPKRLVEEVDKKDNWISILEDKKK